MRREVVVLSKLIFVALLAVIATSSAPSLGRKLPPGPKPGLQLHRDDAGNIVVEKGPPPKPVDILLLGDSMTSGWNVAFGNGISVHTAWSIKGSRAGRR